jgi:hypothetical protein
VYDAAQLNNLLPDGTLANTAVLYNFMAFDPGFTGGVSVAGGDVNGDGHADIVAAPGAGGGPNIRVYDGASGALIRNFLAFDATYLGGIDVALGDINGDGHLDYIVGQLHGASAQVNVFSSTDLSLLASISPYASSGSVAYQRMLLTGLIPDGARVGAVDIDSNGKADIIISTGPGNQPDVKLYHGNPTFLMGDFEAFDTGFLGGVTVA